MEILRRITLTLPSARTRGCIGLGVVTTFSMLQTVAHRRVKVATSLSGPWDARRGRIRCINQNVSLLRVIL